MIRFWFVDDYRDTHEVKRMCKVLGIGRSSYYKWRAGKAARQARHVADAVLVDRIRDHHREWDHTLGYRRMTAELADDDQVEGPVNHKRVARLMRVNNIVGVHLRKPKNTTIKDPGAQVFGDLVNRDFSADAPGRVLVGDITYLPHSGAGEFLYLATVIDVCSKRLVGWSIADHMRTELVENALDNAAAARGSLEGAIFHSDHGRQFTSSDYQATCRRHGVTQSMGRIGSSADNAMAESFNASLKRETLQGAKRWSDEARCRTEVFRWITRYNTRRRHSALRNRSPLDYEADHMSTLDQAA